MGSAPGWGSFCGVGVGPQPNPTGHDGGCPGVASAPQSLKVLPAWRSFGQGHTSLCLVPSPGHTCLAQVYTCSRLREPRVPIPPPSGGWKLHQVLGPGVEMLGEGGFMNLGSFGKLPLTQVSTNETCPPAAACCRFHVGLRGLLRVVFLWGRCTDTGALRVGAAESAQPGEPGLVANCLLYTSPSPRDKF